MLENPTNDYSGKIDESSIFTLEVTYKKDNSAEQILKVPYVIDYVSFEPVYDDSDNWWFLNNETGIIHIMISDRIRTNLMKLTHKPDLTDDEKEDLNMYSFITKTMPDIAAQKAIRFDAYLNRIAATTNTKKTYRTKAKASDAIQSLPSQLAIITSLQYRDGLSLAQSGNAYLQPLATTDGLQFDGKTLFFRGYAASEATLKELNKDKEIDINSIDLPLLKMFYSIILQEFEKNYKESGQFNPIVTVYVPDLAVKMGKSRNLNKADIQLVIDKTASFQSIYGILKDPGRPKGIGTAVPLLVWLGYQEYSNTIQFASPYMTELIKRIYNMSIRKNKQGMPRLKKNGTPETEAVYSYLINSEILKERNKRAVEIVSVVIAVIEGAGRGRANISARTIVQRIPQLKQAVDNASTKSNQNRVLARAFKKAWELLDSHTRVKIKYPNIVLPDPNNPASIPTMATLDMVFTFPINAEK